MLAEGTQGQTREELDALQMCIRDRLKTAKTLNLIGTIGGAVVVVLYIVLIVTGALAMDSLY